MNTEFSETNRAFKKEVEKLTEIFDGDIDFSQEALQQASKDWSLFQIIPSFVAFPKHSKDIQNLVKWTNEYNQKLLKKNEKDPESKEKILSITARSAGTDMSGGPLNDGIIVDVTRYMSGVLSVEKTDEYPDQQSFFGHSYKISGHARALPGTFYRDFEKEAAKENLILPCYPASKNLCAIGGMVANNGAGERSLKYGQNKDFVQELKVVFSDGNEYLVKPLTKSELDAKIAQNDFEGNMYKQLWETVRDNELLINSKKPQTSKNAAGYYVWDVISSGSIQKFIDGKGFFDMTKVIVGAQGTTGIITEILYKLVDIEKASDLLVVYIKDLKDIPELVQLLMKSDLEMLEVYDDKTFRIGMRFFKDFIKEKGFFGAVKYGLRFLPEVWMAIRGGVPKLFVLASFVSNDEEALHKEMKKAVNNIAHLGLRMRQITRDEGEERFWDFRHDSFKLLSEHTKHARGVSGGMRTAPFIEDIVINPEFLPEYLPRLQNTLEKYGVDTTMTVHGHLGNGNLHMVPLLDMQDPENQEKILTLSQEVYALALEYGASITAEHNDGIIRTPFLEQMFGSRMVAVFSRVKDILDPIRLFNPGKKVGMTTKDIKKYLSEG